MRFLEALFFPSDKIQLRVLLNEEKKVIINRLFTQQSLHDFLLSRKVEIEKNSFPCIGVNPRADDKKLSAIQNIVIDIDNAALPDWIKDKADIICSRDELHHHVYFCFEPLPYSLENRETFSETVKKILRLTKSKEKLAHDPERVIRLPGFRYDKKNVVSSGYRIVFFRNEIQRQPFSAKFSWLKDMLPDEEKTENISREKKKNNSNQSIDRACDYLRALYMKKPVLTAGNGRSRELFFIGLDCHAWGIPLSTAIALTKELSTARHKPPENDSVIEHQVKSAFKYRKGEFGDVATRAYSGSEKQQLKELRCFELMNKARDVFSGWVYCHGAVRFIETKNGRAFTSHEQMNTYIASQLGEKFTIDDLLMYGVVETTDAIEYEPSIGDKIFERNGLRFFNSFVSGGVLPDVPKKEAKKAVDVFLEHIHYLTTSEEEERTLLSFFAYALQNPGKKIAWAPLIITPKTGVGKSFFGVLLEKLCGEHNVSPVLSQDLLSRFNDYIAEKLWVIAHEVETGEKEAMARLKSLITEKRVRIDAKYARTYITKNAANFIFLSNKLDAIKSDKEDRRLFVIYNNCEPKEQTYYDILFETVEKYAKAIKDYLLSFDVSRFNPHARPPKTTGWEMLTRASENDLSAFLAEWESEKAGPFANDYFTFRDLLSHIEINAPTIARFVSHRILAVWLYSHGYSHYEIWPRGHRMRIWTKLDLAAAKEAVKKSEKTLYS